MRVDPYLDGTPFQTRVRCLTGFSHRVRAGFFGHGQQVQSSTVSQAVTTIGQTIKMARNVNPTKMMDSNKFLPAVQVVLDGYGKTNPPMNKDTEKAELLTLGQLLTLRSSHSIIFSALVNTPSKVSATTQNKRYSLNLKTINSSNGITRAFSRAYQKMPL
jgi:hypothetical protein